jgi:hypothetical protein
MQFLNPHQMKWIRVIGVYSYNDLNNRWHLIIDLKEYVYRVTIQLIRNDELKDFVLKQ